VTLFRLLLVIVAFFAGSISSITGFGIGTILTPFLALHFGVKLAVAAASVPHFAGNALRFWTLRDKLDKRILRTFGVMSAAGALAGSLLHVFAPNPALRVVLAVLLIVAGILGVTGRESHIRLGRVGAWITGGLSGFFGALIGNQGGLRAAAMLAFDVPKAAFVATATATALIVDAVRMPIYAAHEGRQILDIWPDVAIGAVSVIAGTYLGKALFGRIPEAMFRRLVAALILVLGVAMLIPK
jgi:uncharacterized membrane protein YfcA